MLGRPGCDFSFSGLKTALRHAIDRLPPGPIGARDLADVAASFQAAISEVLADRTANAVAAYRQARGPGGTLVVAGGVAANATIRARLKDLAEKSGLRFTAPPPRLCTDNAAMIGWAGLERLRLGLTDGLDFAPRPRWPLDRSAA
jgi:N6-L-threonylcarbamoyladenine synthase